MFGFMKDIPGYEKWDRIERIDKGWSADGKYRIRDNSGEELLLRVSDIAQYDKKKKEFDIISKIAGIGFLMSMPRAFGVCGGGQRVYMLLSWVEGEDLEKALLKLSGEEQYKLGLEAGKILKSIHSLETALEDIPAVSKKQKKLDQLERYINSPVRIEGDEAAISYVKENIDRIWSLAPVYIHGDFHPGNLIYTPDRQIGVIDFNRWEVGDPYEEFYKLQSFGIEVSVPYCVGQIDAYFGGEVPEGFWQALAVYVAHASLYSIKWAEKFGRDSIDGMTARCRAAFKDYDDFKQIIPEWYRRYKGL